MRRLGSLRRTTRDQAGGPAWNPKQLAGLMLWLRSDLGITLNTTNVSAWADQSGNANNFTQGTGANQPSYTAADTNFNGRPSLTSNGTSQVLTNASFPWAGTTTAFIWIVGHQLTGAVNNDWLSQTGGTPDVRGVGTGNAEPEIVVTAGQSASWNASILAVTKAFYVYVSGTNSGVAVSNATPITSTGTAVALATGSTSLFGRSSGSLQINASIAEVVIASAVPTAAQLTLLQAYATSLYGSV